MNAPNATRRVWAKPLAERGFVAIDPITNPVHWFLFDYDTDEQIGHVPYRSRQSCESNAESMGFAVQSFNIMGDA